MVPGVNGEPTRTIDARWSSDHTEPAAVADALRRLETTRRSDGSSVMPGRALTLVVLSPLDRDDEIRRQLRLVGSDRASRTIIVRRCPDRTTIRGRAAVIAEDRVGSSLHETVVLDIGPADERDLDGILDPLVLTDVPTVGWAPLAGVDLLLSIAPLLQTAIIDSDTAPSMESALEDTAALQAAGLRPIDFAWLRSNPWRVRLAALSRSAATGDLLGELERLEISAAPHAQRCAALLAGWLAHRLGWQAADPPRDRQGHELTIALREAPGMSSGLAALSLAGRGGASLSLTRGPGGLRVAETTAAGRRSERTMIGGSRVARGLLPSALREVQLTGGLDHDVVEMTAELERAGALQEA